MGATSSNMPPAAGRKDSFAADVEAIARSGATPENGRSSGRSAHVLAGTVRRRPAG